MPENNYSALTASVVSGSSFLIFAHVRPDGDALGSSFGLRDALRAAGKRAEVVIPYDMPDRYRSFFKGGIKPQEAGNIAENFDRILVLDCATFERVESGTIELPVSGVPLLNLDHHRGNTTCEVADISYVDPDASSTCQLAVQLAKDCGLELTVSAATSL
ncbi:MAG: DHH family phosphoesterase, partial [Lentisphaeria bacterium]|nr:DHH family phosphoesterase [Lentisphaeria bacterium]